MIEQKIKDRLKELDILIKEEEIKEIKRKQEVDILYKEIQEMKTELNHKEGIRWHKWSLCFGEKKALEKLLDKGE